MSSQELLHSLPNFTILLQLTRGAQHVQRRLRLCRVAAQKRLEGVSSKLILSKLQQTCRICEEFLTYHLLIFRRAVHHSSFEDAAGMPVHSIVEHATIVVRPAAQGLHDAMSLLCRSMFQDSLHHKARHGVANQLPRLQEKFIHQSNCCSFSGRVLEKPNDDATAIPMLRYLCSDFGELFCHEGRVWNGQELNGQLDDKICMW